MAFELRASNTFKQGENSVWIRGRFCWLAIEACLNRQHIRFHYTLRLNFEFEKNRVFFLSTIAGEGDIADSPSNDGLATTLDRPNGMRAMRNNHIRSSFDGQINRATQFGTRQIRRRSAYVESSNKKLPFLVRSNQFGFQLLAGTPPVRSCAVTTTETLPTFISAKSAESSDSFNSIRTQKFRRSSPGRVLRRRGRDCWRCLRHPHI